MPLDRNYYDAVRADITAALEAVAKKHGLSQANATKISVRPDGGGFDVKIECVKQGAASKEASNYAYLHRTDEKLPRLGSKFRNGAKDHEIIGANSTLTKVITSAGGKQFVWPTRVIRDFAERLHLPH